MKRHIPNFITLLNLLSGCIATVFAVFNQLEWAALLVCFGIFFDFLDGLAARLLNVRSDLGIQLDSLADMVTSGLVPGLVMFQLLGMSMTGGWNAGDVMHHENWESLFNWISRPLPFFGFLITLASAYRLARFNIDENQVASFKGLPTPANALLIVSLPLILMYQNNDVLNGLILNPWFLIGLTLVSTYLLNARIQLFALKFKNYGFKDNAIKYLFLIGCIVLLLTMQFLAVPLIVLFYVLSSLVHNPPKQF